MVIGWEEWLASRSAKRANLRRLGLDAPSRRETDHGTDGERLRRAFAGHRVPEWVQSECKPANGRIIVAVLAAVFGVAVNAESVEGQG